MKSYYSIESARTALKTLSNDERLTLEQCISTADSLLHEKMNYFYNEETGEFLELFNLIKKVDCLQNDTNYNLLGLELMISFGGPNTWITIDDQDNIAVQCYWGQQMEIKLGDIGVTLDSVRENYQYLIG